MISEHLDAAKALLVGLTVEESAPKTPSYPYVLVRVAPRDEAALTVVGQHDSFTFRVATTVVAVNPDSANIIASQVAGMLRDKRPGVAGRTCGPIALAGSSGSPVEDLDVNLPGTATRHPVTTTDVWEWQSDPAT